ncbi:MAG TPA: SMC-Scp complex subunit ScpB, partial [Bacillota bacterium]|nr:SMC-Scp complex subunit ScpB [Bacillota bacterium]
ALETLAIIAYKQPITRAEVEAIRGVQSDTAISTLIEKRLIQEVDRLDTVGRPILYGTTIDFLKYFGLSSVKELPDILEKQISYLDENTR